MVVIVKRKGHAEPFDEKKLYASVYASALNAHHNEEDSEEIAQKTLSIVQDAIAGRENLTSEDLKESTITALATHDDVQLMYKHHMDIC